MSPRDYYQNFFISDLHRLSQIKFTLFNDDGVSWTRKNAFINNSRTKADFDVN